MKKVLFISPLDREQIPNSRDRNTAQYFISQGIEVVVMTLAQNTKRAMGDLLRDALTSSHTVTRQNGETLLRIDPLFNPCSGLQSNEKQATQMRGGKSTFRSRLVGLLSPLGLLRDVFIIPTFFWRALRLGAKFDACIAYGPWAAAVAWLLKKCGRASVMVYMDQDYEPGIIGNRFRQRWAARMEISMIRKADVAISAGNRLAALRQQQTGREMTVITNGITPGLFRAVKPEATQPPTLIYMGNVVPWSGLDLLIEALPELQQRNADIRLIIVGGGMPAYIEQLKQLVKSAHLEQHVVFVGQVPVSDLPIWLAQADIGMAHFRPELFRRYAFPLKVVEYMASGLPVIGTENTETEDLIRRYNCGISIPFERAALIDAINLMLADEGLRHLLHVNALKASTEFNWENLLQREYQMIAAAVSQATSGARGV